MVERTCFDVMKKNADKMMERMNETWTGSAQALFRQGGGGRWRGVLDAEDLALYEQAKARVLAPECARWREQGGEVRRASSRL